MFLCCFVFVGAKVMLFFRTPKDTAVFKGKLSHIRHVFSPLLTVLTGNILVCTESMPFLWSVSYACPAAFRQGPDNKVSPQMLCRPYNII